MTGTAKERKVGSGLWWNGGTFSLRSVGEEGGTLPETGAPWRRVPGWLLLPLAPVLGGAFVVALPFVGAFMVAQAVARRAVAGGGQAARDLAATVATPAARPGEAHLTGAPGEPPAGPPAGPPAAPAAPLQGEPLDEVEEEIRARQGRAP